MKKKGRIVENANDWDGIMNSLASDNKHNHLWTVVMKVCLAATVYYIWQERNNGIFQGEEKDKEVVAKMICDDVRSRLMTIKTKRSSAVKIVEREWEVKMC